MSDEPESQQDNMMQELILRAKNGDKDAFGFIYTKYFTPVYRYVYFRVHSKDEANELTQDVFMKAYHAFSRYEAQSDTPLPYFYTIARNTVIDWYKKKKTVSVDEFVFENIVDESMDPSHDAVRNEEIHAMKKALYVLPPDQREAIELRFMAGLSGKEVAQMMEKNEDAVRQLQSRGLKALKGHFTKIYERT